MNACPCIMHTWSNILILSLSTMYAFLTLALCIHIIKRWRNARRRHNYTKHTRRL